MNSMHFYAVIFHFHTNQLHFKYRDAFLCDDATLSSDVSFFFKPYLKAFLMNLLSTVDSQHQEKSKLLSRLWNVSSSRKSNKLEVEKYISCLRNYWIWPASPICSSDIFCLCFSGQTETKCESVCSSAWSFQPYGNEQTAPMIIVEHGPAHT